MDKILYLRQKCTNELLKIYFYSINELLLFISMTQLHKLVFFCLFLFAFSVNVSVKS